MNITKLIELLTDMSNEGIREINIVDANNNKLIPIEWVDGNEGTIGITNT